MVGEHRHAPRLGLRGRRIPRRGSGRTARRVSRVRRGGGGRRRGRRAPRRGSRRCGRDRAPRCAAPVARAPGPAGRGRARAGAGWGRARGPAGSGRASAAAAPGSRRSVSRARARARAAGGETGARGTRARLGWRLGRDALGRRLRRGRPAASSTRCGGRWRWGGLDDLRHRGRRVGLLACRRRQDHLRPPARRGELHRAAGAVALPGDGGLGLDAGDPDLAELGEMAAQRVLAADLRPQLGR